MNENANLARAVHRRALDTPEAIALVCQGQTLSYAELAERAARTAAGLIEGGAVQASGASQRVGILASRSVGACVAALGTAWAGATYVPFGLKQPEERLIELFRQCDLSALITDDAGARLLSPRVIEHCPPLRMHLGTTPAPQGFITATSLPQAIAAPAFVAADATAYIIFTSGSTGTPKGVMVSACAFRRYVEAVTEVLGMRADDRVLGVSELAFDVSAHNMFATWHAGGALHLLPAAASFSAVAYARKAGVTVWNSVPSLVGMLRQMRALGANSLPALRLTAFGGEALPASIVAAWREAAPHAAIFNVYGPTEATVGCMAQRVDEPPPITPGRDVIAIGTPFAGTEAAIVDHDGRMLPHDATGELALAGAQLAQGYLGSPDLTERRFRVIDGKRWYLTGDLALRDAAGRFHCLGRIDNQVKVLGYRIELDEVDAHLRAASGIDVVGSVAWPLVDGAAQGIVAFIGASGIDTDNLITALKERMPAYMVPHQIVALPDMPFNASGKVDRVALLHLLRTMPQ
ncbi:amino acid adenylation domain-containing protein [Noviherbaspirillum pedocola]|uniref:Amino acid adenylation domain-containing protein n=1 Tax=Noviherbaspirillum pedocola TaxID=2801341 RepID=A0A934W9J6_9BURK|nr:amino acid adenylation domain-containing protein [Noviherbaspirillum pedocola]MBK4739000.1 amino acid adenylation domain-containing protein [Noviherbaspirillum pedocola]